MHFFRFAAFSLGYFALFWRITTCAPQPIHPSRLDISCGDLFIGLANPFNDSDSSSSASPSTQHTHGFSTNRGTWKISDTMSLAITICSWKPDPATIQAVLVAAHAAIGKKPSAGLVDETFTQRSDNRYNTLLFEIIPRHVQSQLTWGDVGEVLGEHGLLEFYEETQWWNTIYFTLVDATRGVLGRGAVRRWWQLEVPESRNETASQSSGASVESS